MNNSERIGILMFRYIRNELSKNERNELEAWRKQSPVNEKTFQEAIDPEVIRANLKLLEESRIRRLEQAPVTKTRSLVRRIVVGTLKIAATIIIVLCSYIGVVVYRFQTAHKHPARDNEDQLAAVINFSDLLSDPAFNRGFLEGFADLDIKEGRNGWLIGTIPDTSRQAKDVYYRLFTTEGNRLLLNFKDSTHIWLNSNATIKYPSWQLTDTIRIFLSGESYIHIPLASKHMYEVKISPPVDSTTPSAFKEAVADKISRSMYMFSNGGDFLLKANFGGDATTATLISGSLRIDSVAGKSVTPVNLEPGQQAKLDSGNLQILKAQHFTDSLSWKNP